MYKKLLAGLSLVIFAQLSTATTDTKTINLSNGKGEFSVELSNGKLIEVSSYKPENATNKSPVIFVLTGLKRNSDDYRDAWIDDAKKDGFIIVVPKFDEKNYPGVNGYNLGNLINEDTKQINDKKDWSYGAIEDIFAQMQKDKLTEQANYYLFGNSAGCQFAHRMLTFYPNAKVKATVCSAAGWWTLPDDETPWPYGIADAPVKMTTKSLAGYFAKPILITVGQLDNDPYHPTLRRSYQAMGQGDSRLARAKNYYLTAKQKSKRYKLDFNWIFTSVPDVKHDGAKMSAYAAKQFVNFEKENKFLEN